MWRDATCARAESNRMYFDIISVLYFGMFALTVLWAVVLAWRWRSLPGFAGQVYDSNTEKNLLSAKIDRDAYIASYIRTEWPRSGAFRCATAFVSLLLLPVLVSFFGRILETLWRWAGIGFGPYGLGQIVQDFVLILLVMGVFAGLLYLVTAYYYRTAPPTLAQEIKRLEGEA